MKNNDYIIYMWPKKSSYWIENGELFVSVPFTWELPVVQRVIDQRSWLWKKVVVGGPAVELMPDYLRGCVTKHECPGVLQRVNRLATKTTVGCVRKCKFCAVKTVEPNFAELKDWPDLPVLIDNNLLASSVGHFDKVIDRLVVWGWCDFNQGIDSKLLTDYHSERIAEIGKPIVRLALDSMRYADSWVCAFESLVRAGVIKRNIRSYALIGFDTDPGECWKRCEFVEKFGIKVLPMWFHPLDTLKKNLVHGFQRDLGWDEKERKRIMGWYYRHRGKRGI